MLYPKIRDVNKSNKNIKILFLLSIAISMICMILNYIFSQKLGWSLVAIASIIYLWITITYSITYNVNIASHTMIQTICISLFVIVIDYVFGELTWSLVIAVPIILLLSNIIMLILTILKTKKDNIYAIYKSIIFIFSVFSNLVIIIAFKNNNMILNWISLAFSLYNLSIVLAINGRNMVNEWKRRFHV